MIRLGNKRLRLLDFDCECRPLSWYGGDFTTKEITAVAWSWLDEEPVYTSLLTAKKDPLDVLRPFLEAYDEANIVTGHYIRAFDLPLISGALTEFLRPPLGDKLASDTKLDMIRRHGMSNSQESIGAMLGLSDEKYHMTQQKWREANRLTRDGLRETAARVSQDVTQHKAMRARMAELGWLAPPKIWSAQPKGRFS